MIKKTNKLTCVALAALAMGISPAMAQDMEDYPLVRLRSLDKITARTETMDVKVGSTVEFGNIMIKVQACRKAPPVEEPESAAFLQIWENGQETSESEWIFSGWMFASSPGLSHMDHPVYDVWVLDCTGREEPPPPPAPEAQAPETEETVEEAAPAPEAEPAPAVEPVLEVPVTPEAPAASEDIPPSDPAEPDFQGD